MLNNIEKPGMPSIPACGLEPRGYEEVQAGIDHQYDRPTYDGLARVYWDVLQVATQSDRDFRARTVAASERQLSLDEQRSAKVGRRLSRLAPYHSRIVKLLDERDRGMVGDNQETLAETYSDSLAQVAELYGLEYDAPDDTSSR